MKYWMTIFCLIVTLACKDSSSNDPDMVDSWTPEASEEWPTATPGEVGVDRNDLNDAYLQAGMLNHLKSMLVVKEGYLIAEQYYQGLNSGANHDVRSVTKTVMSMLLGIALDQGIFTGVDQPIGPFFIEQYPDLSAEKQAITLEHLLTMTSGFEWHESDGNSYSDWINSSDHTAYVLNRNLESAPGTQFNYNSGAVHLLSVILTEASGQSTLAFANEHLFNPLSFQNVFWEQLSGGYHNGGAGLDLRPRDMAKLGKLFLSSGRYNALPLIPSTWIERAKAPTRNSSGIYGPLTAIDYGYLWWLGLARDTPIELAWGWGGQFIATFPDRDLTVIATSNWQVNAGTANQQEEAILHVIVDQVLPASQ